MEYEEIFADGAGEIPASDVEVDARGRPISDKQRVSNQFTSARARKMDADASKAELELAQKEGTLVMRAAVSQVAATAVAAFAQAVRSIPDQLEREHGLSPVLVQAVAESLDSALNALADEFKMFSE